METGDPNRTLAEKAAGGDREALARLLEQHLPTVRAFVRLRAGPAVRAREVESDLVQSVCREVLEHADDFRHAEESGFKRWLYVTTLRKVLHKDEYHRAERRDPGREVVALEGQGDAQLVEAYGSFASPSQDAIAGETRARLESAFDRISEDERSVILLSRIVGLPRSEVASEMGRSEASVRNLLHRALAKLGRLLADG